MSRTKESMMTYKEAKEEAAFEALEATLSAANRQVGGDHYKGKTCQVWDIINEYGLDYYRGNAIKYILRNKMNTQEDIKKAIHYLEYFLETFGEVN